jgi:hypothetical protein
MDRQAVIGASRRWVSSVVIGLNLCPFARRVFTADKIRYVVSDAKDEDGLLKDLADEIKALVSTPLSVFETTLLIHPCVLGGISRLQRFSGNRGAADRRTWGAGQRPARWFPPRLPVRGRGVHSGGELYESIPVPDAPSAA